MCLFSPTSKPLVSDKDLVVIKKLARKKDGLYTPFYGMEVKLGSMLRANGEFIQLTPSYTKNEIGGGMIHAYMDRWFAYIEKWQVAFRTVASAVIPAGTPFYASHDLKQIAAKEMRIMEIIPQSMEGFGFSKLEETQGEVRRLLLEQEGMVSKNGVRVGDILLSDCKTFMHVEDIAEGIVPIGIVSFIRPDGTPNVTALRDGKEQWAKRAKTPAERCGCTLYAKTFMDDFDGYGNTMKFTETFPNTLERYPAMEYCVNYATDGTKPGDWYMPSCGEMVQTCLNNFFINETVIKLILCIGIQADSMVKYGQYWTSNPFSSCNQSVCCVEGLKKFYDPLTANNVRPSLHLD